MTLFTQFNQAKRCRYGTVLYNVNDAYVGRSLALYGEFSEGEVEVFRQILAPGCVALDVGANIGAHTLFFAQAVGPEGAVLAFEPQRIVFQTLCANMALNSVTNTRCIQAAVGEAPGRLLAPPMDYGRANNFGGIALGGFEAGEEVDVLRLDDFDLPHCRLIKVDVEGMELSVLKGAAGLIAQHRPLLYVENDKPEKSDALIRHIAALGYDQYWHNPTLFNPENHDGNPDNVFPRVVSRNMLCIPQELGQQLTGFPRVQVPAAQ